MNNLEHLRQKQQLLKETILHAIEDFEKETGFSISSLYTITREENISCGKYVQRSIKIEYQELTEASVISI